MVKSEEGQEFTFSVSNIRNTSLYTYDGVRSYITHKVSYSKIILIDF